MRRRPTSPGFRAGGSGSVPLPAPPAPARIGAFPVVRWIGEGGMGHVFACRDERLDRLVAVKILRPELMVEPVLVKRFLREAQAMARISSPYVVTVHQVGEHEGAPFLVMELLEGEDLAARLARAGPLEQAEALRYIHDAARGLRAAREAGIVHRDVKPANLFVVQGHVKLTDFGLARPPRRDLRLTQEGLVVGTPHYIAPEAVRGELADEFSDMYALGVTLYELLSGAPPFGGEGVADVLQAHLRARVPSLQRAGVPVEESVDVLVSRLLAKEARDRFPDYPSLETAIHHTLSALPLPAASGGASPGSPHPPPRFLSSAALRTLRYWGMAAAGMGLVALLAWWLRGAWPGHPPVLPAQDPTPEAARALVDAAVDESAGPDLLLRAHAHRVLGDEAAALGLYERAFAAGALDERMLAFLVVRGVERAAGPAEAELALLEGWPSPLTEVLSPALGGEWWPRHNALRVLEKRMEATDAHRLTVGKLDLAQGETCARRRFGFSLLRRANLLSAARPALLEAQARMPENRCMARELADALR